MEIMEMFQTHYNREERKREVIPPDTQTEQVGYLSAEKQVMRLIQAGVRLDDFRKEQFHFGTDEEVSESFFDPELEPNFDLVDAKNEFDAAMARISNAEKASRAGKAAKSKGVEMGSGETTDVVSSGNSAEKAEG